MEIQQGLIPVATDLNPYLEQASKLTEGIASLALQTKELQITGDDTRRQMCDLMNKAKSITSGLTALWKPVKDRYNIYHKELLANEKKTTEESIKIAELCTAKLKVWDQAQIEAKRKIEADLARQAREQQAELDRKAKELLAEGYVAEAKKVANEVNLLDQMPVLPAAIEKVAGTSVTKVWKADVTDLRAIINAIATGKVQLMQECNGQMRSLLMVDQPVLNAMVKRLGDGLNIPGVQVDEDIRYGRR